MLKPLEEWICDKCGEIIKAPEEGYVEWMDTDGKAHGFRIVHHQPFSPRKSAGKDCYYSNHERGGDLPLTDFTGTRGLIQMVNFIDVGPFHQSEYAGPEVLDLREWAVLFRRLHLPYYEEARLCTEQMEEEIAGGANEMFMYLPKTLKSVIEQRDEDEG